LAQGGATRFKPGVSGNPGGKPKGMLEFRALCRSRTEEIIKTLEILFFTGYWPKQKNVKRQRLVGDTVRMRAGELLVAHGWGVPPQSHNVQIPLPESTAIKHVTEQMTAEQAAELYAQTLRQGFYDDSGAGGAEPTKLIEDQTNNTIDVEPNNDGGQQTS
jgi:Family of unknown function (DUF5681)